VIVHDLDDQERKVAYNSDVTYGTNNEYGFDYLSRQHEVPHRGLRAEVSSLRIVDEVDSILIDEARTPLIISGPSEESTDKYYKINRIIPKLIKGEVMRARSPAKSGPPGTTPSMKSIAAWVSPNRV